MTFSELSEHVDKQSLPTFNNDTEKCLWLCGTGNWTQAHDIVEALPEPAASWIHAMLHRDEGDLSNAGYWYARAGQAMPDGNVSIKQEWQQIASQLIAD